METFTLYALTPDTELDTLMAIEKQGRESLEEDGYEVVDAYSFFAFPDVIDSLPSEAIMEAIASGSSIAVIMYDYEEAG